MGRGVGRAMTWGREAPGALFWRPPPMAARFAAYLRGTGVPVRWSEDPRDLAPASGRLIVITDVAQAAFAVRALEVHASPGRAGLIVLHAAGAQEAGLAALEQGADDIFCETGSPRELLARLRALARRCRRAGEAGDAAWCGPAWWRLPTTAGLTSGDLRILQALAAQPGAVLSREEILDRAAAPGPEGYDRAVDCAIYRLRRRLRAATGRDPIVTRRGAGYALDGAAFAALAGGTDGGAAAAAASSSSRSLAGSVAEYGGRGA